MAVAGDGASNGNGETGKLERFRGRQVCPQTAAAAAAKTGELESRKFFSFCCDSEWANAKAKLWYQVVPGSGNSAVATNGTVKGEIKKKRKKLKLQ